MMTVQVIGPVAGTADDSLFRVDRAPLGRQCLQSGIFDLAPSTLGRSKSNASPI
jgi:hypothetical protein